MNYLFYGTEQYLIEKEIKKIINDSKLDKINVNYYDLENTFINDIIDDALTFSLFDDKKIIVVENSYIFTGTTNKKLLDQDTKQLEEYLDHPNENTILIFSINKDKIDGRKKITTKMKKQGCVKEFNEITNLNKYISELFGEYNISNEDLRLFQNRVGDNLLIIEQEIKKIKTYKDKDLNITKDDIINLTNKNVNVDIFKLIENIICGNKEDAIESYNEMLKLGEEPIKIIVMLANQIRIIYQAKELSKKGYREKDIAQILDIHPYRVKLALTNGYKYTSSILLKKISELAQMDIDIKKGLVDKSIALELFIVSN